MMRRGLTTFVLIVLSSCANRLLAHSPVNLAGQVYTNPGPPCYVMSYFHDLRFHPSLYLPEEGGWGLHRGVDIAMDTGTPLLALGTGIVVRAEDDAPDEAGAQNFIAIDYGGVVVEYFHILQNSAAFAQGDTVALNQIVALSGALMMA